MAETRRLMTLAELAQATGLPETWLLRAGRAGDIPCLQAGDGAARNLRFSLKAVELTLQARAEADSKVVEATR